MLAPMTTTPPPPHLVWPGCQAEALTPSVGSRAPSWHPILSVVTFLPPCDDSRLS